MHSGKQRALSIVLVRGERGDNPVRVGKHLRPMSHFRRCTQALAPRATGGKRKSILSPFFTPCRICRLPRKGRYTRESSSAAETLIFIPEAGTGVALLPGIRPAKFARKMWGIPLTRAKFVAMVEGASTRTSCFCLKARRKLSRACCDPCAKSRRNPARYAFAG